MYSGLPMDELLFEHARAVAIIMAKTEATVTLRDRELNEMDISCQPKPLKTPQSAQISTE